MTDPPNEAKVRKEIKILKLHKSLDLDDLPPGLFKNSGDLLVKELSYLQTSGN